MHIYVYIYVYILYVYIYIYVYIFMRHVIGIVGGTCRAMLNQKSQDPQMLYEGPGRGRGLC